MKKIVYTLGMLTSMLLGDCVHLSTHAIGMCQDDTVQIDLIRAKFNKTLSYTHNSVLDIPLYLAVDSDTPSDITLHFNGLLQLNQAKQSPIRVKYYYVQGTHVTPINTTQSFTLQHNYKGKRNDKIGDIRLVIEQLQHNESAGSYNASLSASIQKGIDMASNTMQIEAKIDEVIHVSFVDNVQSLTSGIAFMGATVDLARVSQFESAHKSLPVYVQNNTPNGCTMSIEPAPLRHTIYTDRPTIPLHFFYTPVGGVQHEISSHDAFYLTHAKNNGTPVGTFTIRTEVLQALYLAGQYTANIPVTIQAR